MERRSITYETGLGFNEHGAGEASADPEGASCMKMTTCLRNKHRRQTLGGLVRSCSSFPKNNLAPINIY